MASGDGLFYLLSDETGGPVGTGFNTLEEVYAAAIEENRKLAADVANANRELEAAAATPSPERRGGEQGFKSTQQRKLLESLNNSRKAKLKGKQLEAFKRAIEDAKVGEQFLDKDELIQIFEEIQSAVNP